MKALILLSHGSRRRESNKEMIQLAQSVAAIEGHSFTLVACAFQQFGQPDFGQTLADLFAAGADHIVVYPLFLASGNHVLVDVPEMIARARTTYPDVLITVMPHMGKTQNLAAFLMTQAVGYA